MKNNYPKSRTDEIVVQELNGEILVYDLRDNRAMCLNETSSAVWKACDGSNSVADIAKSIGSEDLVWLALAELKKERLVSVDELNEQRLDGVSRRDVIKKIGLGSMIALPIISTMVAPQSIHAISACVTANGGCVCSTTTSGSRPPGTTCTATFGNSCAQSSCRCVQAGANGSTTGNCVP